MKGMAESTKQVVGALKQAVGNKQPSIRSNSANRIAANSVAKRVGAKPGDNAEKAMNKFMNKRGIPVSDARQR